MKFFSNTLQSTYKPICCIFMALLTFASCNNPDDAQDTDKTVNSETKNEEVSQIQYKLIQTYPHDTAAFTEGLFFYNNQLFESTGATPELPFTRSLFGVLNLKTGKIEIKAEIDKQKYFGEGIALIHGKIYQLTYKTKIGFVYDAKSYKKLGDFTYPSAEGWGLTNDDSSLIMSDGTNKITYLHPETFKVIKTLNVTQNGYATEKLNELEYMGGYIYANIWTTQTIVKINPKNGHVEGVLDLNDLAYEARHYYKNALEMNGIAFDPVKKRIFITGKLWPRIYELELKE